MQLLCPGCRNTFVVPQPVTSPTLRCPLCQTPIQTAPVSNASEKTTSNVPVGKTPIPTAAGPNVRAKPAPDDREQLGWLAFVLSAAFALCLFLVLVATAWFDLTRSQFLMGLFGCGIPAVLAGAATCKLWEKRPILKRLGGTALLYGAANCLCFLLGVLTLVLFPSQICGRWFAALLGFSVMMVVSGAWGAAVIRAHEQLALLAFALTAAFAICVFLILVAEAWFGLSPLQMLIGFIGCGIPAVLAGVATCKLWVHDKAFGWFTLVYSAANAFCLLLGVLTLVLFPSQMQGCCLFAALLGFLVAMIVSGATGVAIIRKQDEPPRGTNFDPGSLTAGLIWGGIILLAACGMILMGTLEWSPTTTSSGGASGSTDPTPLDEPPQPPDGQHDPNGKYEVKVAKFVDGKWVEMPSRGYTGNDGSAANVVYYRYKKASGWDAKWKER